MKTPEISMPENQQEVSPYEAEKMRIRIMLEHGKAEIDEARSYFDSTINELPQKTDEDQQKTAEYLQLIAVAKVYGRELNENWEFFDEYWKRLGKL